MKLFILFLLTTLTLKGFSQTIDLELATQLKKQFENELCPVVGINSTVVHSFQFNSKAKKIEVIVKENTSIIALKNNAEIKITKLKDNETEIDYFLVYGGKKLKSYRKVEQHCYSNFSKEIFSSDLIACQYHINIKDFGQKKRYEYQETYKDVKYLVLTSVTEYLPFQKKNIVYRIPKGLNIQFREINLEGFDFVKSESFNEKNNEKIITYSFNNIRAYIDEDNSQGYTWIEPHIVPIVSSFTNQKGEVIKGMGNINDMYLWYKSLTNSVNNENDSLINLVNRLTEGNQTDYEKAKSIFYWVQDNIKYIAFEDGIMGFKPDGAYNVYSKKYGDCKGMANLTKNMLQLANLDARLTWIGTTHVSDKYNYSFPSLVNDNHMICTVIIDSLYYFLDPTENFIAIGDYTARIQGRKVLIEDGDNYLIKEVPSFGSEHNKKEVRGYLKMKGDSLIGNFHLSYIGEEKTSLLWSYDVLRTDTRKERLTAFLSGNNKNIEIYDYTHSDIKDRHKALTFDYKISIGNRIVATENEVYVSMNLYNDFDYINIEADRKSDFNLYYKPFHTEKTILQIPQKYNVQYLPTPLFISNEEYEIDYSYRQENDQIILVKKIKFKIGIISLRNAERWKTVLKQMKDFYSEQIVLTEK